MTIQPALHDEFQASFGWWCDSGDCPHDSVQKVNRPLFSVTKLQATRPAPVPALDELTIQLVTSGTVNVAADVGHGQFSCNGDASGTFLVTPANIPLQIEGSGGFELLTVSIPWDAFLRRFEGLTASGLEDLRGFHGGLYRDPNILRLVWCLWRECEQNSTIDSGLSTHLADQMLIHLGSQTGAIKTSRIKKPAPHSFDRWKKMLSRMHDDLNLPVTIDDLAEEAGVSKFHFARLFQKVTGLSPMQYRMNLRIEQAKARLLLERSRSLVEISIDCGFADQSHFGRHFKRIAGTTPQRWRDK